jgi:hypothetical protein
MAYRPAPDDPFGYEKVPSLSWKDLPVGSTFSLEVLEPAKALQSTNFETQQPDYWDAEHTRPKMAAVINVRVVAGPHSVGEVRSIWAQIPSNLFVAIKNAQKAADAPLAPGGLLHLRFAGTVVHENKRYSPIKQYEAKYTPPAAAPDPFIHEFAPEAQPSAAPAAPAAPAPAKPVTSGWR